MCLGLAEMLQADNSSKIKEDEQWVSTKAVNAPKLHFMYAINNYSNIMRNTQDLRNRELQ